MVRQIPDNNDSSRILPDVSTWRCLMYALLALPLGVAYAVLLSAGLALGVLLLPFGMGLPLLTHAFDMARNMAASERHLLRVLLGEHIAAVEPAAVAGLVPRLRAHLTAPATWRGLTYLLLRLPLGIVSFALTGGVFNAALVLLSTPFTYVHAPLDIGFARIDTSTEAALCALLGVLLIPLGLQAARLLARMWVTLGHMLLTIEKPKRIPARTVVIYSAE